MDRSRSAPARREPRLTPEQRRAVAEGLARLRQFQAELQDRHRRRLLALGPWLGNAAIAAIGDAVEWEPELEKEPRRR